MVDGGLGTRVSQLRRETHSSTQDKLFSLLKQTETGGPNYDTQLGEFKTYIRLFRRLAATDVAAVVQLACAKGLHQHLDLLLQKGVDPSGTGVHK
jgi:hypothetical protein